MALCLMRRFLSSLAFTVFATLLIGCAGLVRGPVSVTSLAATDSSNRRLVLLSQTPYLADLASALGEYGFHVRPLVRQGQGQIAATGGGSGFALFENERYGLQIDQVRRDACAFTGSSIYDFKFTVIDIRTNEVMMVVRQTGSDGPCSTVKPVWSTVAQAIAKNWGVAPTRHP